LTRASIETKAAGESPPFFVCKVIVTLRIRRDPRATLVIPGSTLRAAPE